RSLLGRPVRISPPKMHFIKRRSGVAFQLILCVRRLVRTVSPAFPSRSRARHRAVSSALIIAASSVFSCQARARYSSSVTVLTTSLSSKIGATSISTFIAIPPVCFGESLTTHGDHRHADDDSLLALDGQIGRAVESFS